MVSFLSKVRTSGGDIPPDHHSHDHLNEQKQVPVDSGVIEKWAEEFRRIGEERGKLGEKVTWVLLDGFLLYWNQVRSCYRIHEYRHTVMFLTGSRRPDRCAGASESTSRRVTETEA